MPRACECCAHPDRAAIEAEIIAGRPIRAVARAHALTPAALHRHARNHLPAALAVAAAAHLAAMIDAGTAPHLAPVSDQEMQPAEAPPENETGFTAPPSFTPHTPRAWELSDAEDAQSPQGSPPASIVPMVAPSPPPAAPIAPSTAPAGPMGLLDLALSLRDRALGILAAAEASGDRKTALAAIREARGVLESLARLEPAGSTGPAVPLAQSEEWAELRTLIVAALADHPDARLAVAAALAGAGALA